MLSLAILAALIMWWGPASQVPCDPTRSETQRQSGESALQKKHFEEAAKNFQDAFDACPSRHSILLQLSEADVRRREFDLAIGAAQQFLNLEPASLPGQLALANAFFTAQRLPEALRQADSILKAYPDEPAAFKIKGNAEYLAGHSEEAVKSFMALLDLHPDDQEAAYMLGRIYYQEGHMEQATGLFQRVLRMNPKAYKAFDNLGLCYEALGDQDMAARHFLTAIKLAEEDGADYDWAYANMANLLLEKGDAERAFSAASKAVDRNPYSARNFYLGGKALALLGKNDLSVNWLQRSAALDPKYPEPLYLLAKVYKELGRQAESKETLEKFRLVKASAPRERK